MAEVSDPPNFILFIVDDVSWNDFGCYGNRAARTPHIDKLAANGIRFENFYLTASSCSPSRSSIITGRYPHNNGRAVELHLPLSSHLIKFPSVLKDDGYYTALAGKDHMPQIKPNEAAVWDVKKGRQVPGNSSGAGHWVDVVRKRPKDRPFFFWFAAVDAHRDWDGDREWVEENYGPRHDPSRVVVPPALVDTEATRKDLASYYNEVTRFDWFVGRVVNELKRQKALDNTLIMVMADNGSPFPRAKTRLHDDGMKTAFVAHWPQGISRPGSTCSSLLSAVDISPTILEIASAKRPSQTQGISFAKLFRSPASQVRRYAFSEHNWHDYEAHGRSVRDREGYLYIRNARPNKAWIGPADSVGSPSHKELVKASKSGKLTPAQADVLKQPRAAEELYFTPKDPTQVNCLLEDRAHATKLAELRRVMDRWQDVTGDSVPKNLSPDFFDRKLGYINSRTGKPIRGHRPVGEPPGLDRGADRINEPGPR
ncbi:MAG: sulfatase [Pirellulales bacterium]|nr:sulfatase [Pirellulales bacterium]